MMAAATGGQTELPTMRTCASFGSGFPLNWKSIWYVSGKPCAR
jgi:hypothetical protein